MSADKIIITEDGEEINLTTLEREFGSYQFEGKTYYATRQMEFTNREFLGCFEEASPNIPPPDMTKTETPWKSS